MIWAAGRYTVYDDEAFSCQRYVLPMNEMVSALWHGIEPDPPLYYILQNLAVRIWGVSPLGLRALSVLMFVAGLVAIRAAAEAWFDRATGIATLVICALHPAHLFFGFAARWYSAMFLAVATLLWATRRLATARDEFIRPSGTTTDAGQQEPSDESLGYSQSGPYGTNLDPRQAGIAKLSSRSLRYWTATWAFSAAAVCYTNYFGVIVVSLVWAIAFAHALDKRRVLFAGFLAALLFSPWLPPFWKQINSFPKMGGSFTATAARTVMALLAGDLASHRAGYVWMPMALFLICLVLLLVRQWRYLAPIAFITFGCLAAGIASRTMIDKYIMTFSGPSCILAAAMLVSAPRSAEIITRRATTVSIFALTLAWTGCSFNLVTQKNWSSLRWLDPFDLVTRECLSEDGGPIRISTHPSARYYFAVNGLKMPIWSIVGDPKTRELHHKKEMPPRWFWPTAAMFRKVALDERTTYESIFDGSSPGYAAWRVRESSTRIPPGRGLAILSIETSEFADSPEWQDLRNLLAAKYELAREEKYLEDTDADWKDRLDPTFKHPRWRIIVRKWCPKSR